MKDILQVAVMLTVAVAGLIFVRKSKVIRPKRQALAIVFFVALLAGIGVGQIPLGFFSPGFPSLEDAYLHKNPKRSFENTVIVPGNTSSMVISYNPDGSAAKLDFYYQTDKGWKVGEEKDTEPEWETYVKESVVNLQMFRCRETGERFLHIVSAAQNPLEITDSLNTKFVQEDHRYFACIGTVKQGYSLEINGTPVTIPKISSK